MSNELADPSLLGSPSDDEPSDGDRLVLRDILLSFERKLIATVLLAAGGNQKRAALALGVLPTTFQEKLKRFGLTHQHFDRRGRRGERRAGRSASHEPRVEANKTPQEKSHK